MGRFKRSVKNCRSLMKDSNVSAMDLGSLIRDFVLLRKRSRENCNRSGTATKIGFDLLRARLGGGNHEAELRPQFRVKAIEWKLWALFSVISVLITSMVLQIFCDALPSLFFVVICSEPRGQTKTEQRGPTTYTIANNTQSPKCIHLSSTALNDIPTGPLFRYVEHNWFRK